MLKQSLWFIRGWTLQERLVSATVQFFDREGKFIRSRHNLISTISKVTAIPRRALRGRQISKFTVVQCMPWAASRNRTRSEDKAFYLLRIFNVYIPLIYREGSQAINRLSDEIYRSTTRQSDATGLGTSINAHSSLSVSLTFSIRLDIKDMRRLTDSMPETPQSKPPESRLQNIFKNFYRGYDP